MSTEKRRKEAKLKIILDSSALFVPIQFRIDIFEELKNLLKTNFEPVLLSTVLQELKAIAQKSKPSMRKKTSYALQLAQKCHLIKTNEKFASPDDAIVEFAKRWKCPVFTNDRALRRRLRNISVPVIYVRQKSRLEVDGRI
ncbi:MAG: PIN domain-containing protein [Candidatus Bathyarchaeia archaeon]